MLFSRIVIRGVIILPPAVCFLIILIVVPALVVGYPHFLILESIGAPVFMSIWMQAIINVAQETPHKSLQLNISHMI